jgi:hypothetical protein
MSLIEDHHPTLPTDDEVRGLRRWNIVAMLLHLASAIGVLAIANDFTLPVNAAYPEGPPGAAESWPVTNLFDVPLAYAAATFALLSALAHLGTFSFARRVYERDLARGINQLRWIEYSISSTLMILLISQLVGIFDITALLGIAGANISMILFGWMHERQALDRRAAKQPVAWWGFVFGCITGLVPWIAITIYMLGAPEVPGFVIGIFVSLFVFFNSFALVMLLEYARIGPWKRVLVAERSYIVLSFTAKLLLTWQVAINVLID